MSSCLSLTLITQLSVPYKVDRYPADQIGFSVQRQNRIITTYAKYKSILASICQCNPGGDYRVLVYQYTVVHELSQEVASIPPHFRRNIQLSITICIFTWISFFISYYFHVFFIAISLYTSWFVRHSYGYTISGSYDVRVLWETNCF